VRSSSAISPNELLRIRLSRGELEAMVTDTRDEASLTGPFSKIES
jgi:hypothetical protein